MLSDGTEALDLIGIDELGIDAEMLVHLGAPTAGAHGGVGMGEREMAAHRIEDVVVELLAQPLIEAHGFIVEAHALGRQIVGTDDRRVARRVSAGEIALVEDGDVGDAPVLGEIIGRGEAMTAGAHDHHVVSGLQILRLGKVAPRGILRAQPVFQKPEWHSLDLETPVIVVRQATKRFPRGQGYFRPEKPAGLELAEFGRQCLSSRAERP